LLILVDILTQSNRKMPPEARKVQTPGTGVHRKGKDKERDKERKKSKKKTPAGRPKRTKRLGRGPIRHIFEFSTTGTVPVPVYHKGTFLRQI